MFNLADILQNIKSWNLKPPANCSTIFLKTHAKQTFKNYTKSVNHLKKEAQLNLQRNILAFLFNANVNQSYANVSAVTNKLFLLRLQLQLYSKTWGLKPSSHFVVAGGLTLVTLVEATTTTALYNKCHCLLCQQCVCVCVYVCVWVYLQKLPSYCSTLSLQKKVRWPYMQLVEKTKEKR